MSKHTKAGRKAAFRRHNSRPHRVSSLAEALCALLGPGYYAAPSTYSIEIPL